MTLCALILLRRHFHIRAYESGAGWNIRGSSSSNSSSGSGSGSGSSGSRVWCIMRPSSSERCKVVRMALIAFHEEVMET